VHDQVTPLPGKRKTKKKIRTVVQGTIDFFLALVVRFSEGGEVERVCRSFSNVDGSPHTRSAQRGDAAFPVLFLPKGQSLLLTITEPTLSLTLGDASNYFI